MALTSLAAAAASGERVDSARYMYVWIYLYIYIYTQIYTCIHAHTYMNTKSHTKLYNNHDTHLFSRYCLLGGKSRLRARLLF